MGVDFIDAIPGDVFGAVVVDLGELVRAGSATSLLRVRVRAVPGANCCSGTGTGRVV